MSLDTERTREFVQRAWDGDIVPALTEYIRIPAKSPMYDTRWAEHGHIERAVTLITEWARRRKIEGLAIEVVRLEGRTPVILMEAPGAGGETVLLYGHCDKQPEMVGWAADGGPWTPVRRGNRLFGRGAGDDGYAAFSALTAIEAWKDDLYVLTHRGAPHHKVLRTSARAPDVARARVVVPQGDSIIEAKRGRHSQKPVAAYEWIERMYSSASKLELFARGRPRPDDRTSTRRASCRVTCLWRTGYPDRSETSIVWGLP